MTRRNETTSRLSSAIEATRNLSRQRFRELMQEGNIEAQIAHAEIENLPVAQRSGRFYGRFIPLLDKLVSPFTDAYRRYFKLALANPQECGPDLHEWACNQLEDGIAPVFEWIEDWYALACDGENRNVQRIASIPFTPGETVSVPMPTINQPLFAAVSWQAPAWLFAVSPLMGIGPLKTKNVPNMESEGRLSKAHTRLLLKGMRKVFLWKLRHEIEIVQNEEIAAAGTIAANLTEKRAAKLQSKGFEGLGPKRTDLSQYTDGLTEKQRMAFSLKYEYGCGLVEIASRMEINHKTASEHIVAAKHKIEHNRANEKRKAQRTTKNTSD